MLKKQGLSCKSPEFYERKRDMFVMKEVNIEAFIKNLESQNDEFQGPMLRKSQTLQARHKFKDPVLDPNETWTQMIDRIVNFKEPKLIERSELLKNKKKTNLLHKFNSFVYEDTLEKNRQKRSEMYEGSEIPPEELDNFEKKNSDSEIEEEGLKKDRPSVNKKGIGTFYDEEQPPSEVRLTGRKTLENQDADQEEEKYLPSIGKRDADEATEENINKDIVQSLKQKKEDKDDSIQIKL